MAANGNPDFSPRAKGLIMRAVRKGLRDGNGNAPRPAFPRSPFAGVRWGKVTAVADPDSDSIVITVRPSQKDGTPLSDDADVTAKLGVFYGGAGCGPHEKICVAVTDVVAYLPTGLDVDGTTPLGAMLNPRFKCDPDADDVTMAGTGEDADATEWDRETDGELSVTLPSRPAVVSADEIHLLQFTRVFVFDCRGLKSVSAETKVMSDLDVCDLEDDE